MERKILNNVVSMEGVIMSPFNFSHEVFGEGFYTVTLRVPRLSDQNDDIMIVVSERLIDVKEDMTDVKVRIQGQFRSYNQNDGERNHLVLSVFAREVDFLDSDQAVSGTQNEIYLNGYVCKSPIYRKTPLGREITDILIAVNRSYGKSDYIPCIAWGRNARFSAEFEIGTHVEIWGRIQSREYNKKLNDSETEKRVAFEVSISKLDVFPYFMDEQTNEQIDEEKS